MVISYSSLNRFEKPLLTLCNPGSVYNNGYISNSVGILTDVSDMEAVFNFNSTSELNFRVNRVKHDGTEEAEYAYSMYKAIQNRRLLFVEGIGYFVISDVKDGYSDGSHHKDVTALSADVELQQKMIPFIKDGTYRFSTEEGGETKGLLESIVETIPLWTISHIDNSVKSKYRTFKDIDTETNCLSFMLNNMQDAYECIFLFDPINREISVYDQSNYVRQTSIHITKDDIINSLDINEDSDNLYTAINVIGDNNETISAINPIGTNTIYDFGNYIEWMTPSLGAKVLSWQNQVNSTEQSYYNLNLRYYNLLGDASEYEFEIDRLNTQLLMYNRCKENIIAKSDTSMVDSYNGVIEENGGSPITIYEHIQDTIDEIESLISDCEIRKSEVSDLLDDINIDIEAVKEQISTIQSGLSFSGYFSQTELDELSNYIYEGSYKDEYIAITDIMSYEDKFEQMKLMYDRAKLKLNKVSKPTQEFNIDIENFIFAKEFSEWAEQIETGCVINVDIGYGDKDGDDTVVGLFLSDITVNYEDNSVSMTFGNRYNKFDTKSLFDDTLGKISKSANSISSIKETIYPIKNGEIDSMKESIANSRMLSANAAIYSDNQEVLIDGAGITSRKRVGDSYSPEQLKITGNSIVFTDNNWESCKTAIGKIPIGNGNFAYGINAETLIGDVIIGEKGIIRSMTNSGGYSIEMNNGSIDFYDENSPTPVLLGSIIGASTEYDGDDVSALVIDTSNMLSVTVSGEPYVIFQNVTNNTKPIIFPKQTMFTSPINLLDSSVIFNDSVYQRCYLMNLYGDLYTGSDMLIGGDLTVSGTKNRVVETENFGSVKLNAVESPSAVFCDTGSGVINDEGICEVVFDPVFYETIDHDCEYTVFTSITNNNGATNYISKDQTGFVVHGEPDTRFDWIIYAKQKGYQGVYLDKAYMKPSDIENNKYIYNYEGDD